MSYSKNQNKKSNLFCKVCYNKGDVKLSRTHNTCDEKGKNCCPTLAAFTCKYCDENGHTQKFCTKKKLDAEREIRENYRLDASLKRYRERLAKEAALLNTSEKENVSAKTKPAGAFAALLDESDDESEGETDSKKALEKVQTPVQEMSTARAALMGLWVPPKRKVCASKCWADFEESDEEDGDEYHDYIDARKAWGCEEMDKLDRERLARKNK